MKQVYLSGKHGRGKFALVDDEDFSQVSSYNWFASKSGYAECTRYNGRLNGKQTWRKIKMHRLIMNTPKDKDTDHINGNPLDNRKVNLRVCETQQNCFNRRMNRNNKSGYKGVFLQPKSRLRPWHVTIRFSGKTMNLGSYDDIVEAAKAYNVKALELFGEFANLNIIPKG